jgi:hypothetical protein
MLVRLLARPERAAPAIRAPFLHSFSKNYCLYCRH